LLVDRRALPARRGDGRDPCQPHHRQGPGNDDLLDAETVLKAARTVGERPMQPGTEQRIGLLRQALDVVAQRKRKEVADMVGAPGVEIEAPLVERCPDRGCRILASPRARASRRQKQKGRGRTGPSRFRHARSSSDC
jgi:hypothetical protein